MRRQLAVIVHVLQFNVSQAVSTHVMQRLRILSEQVAQISQRVGRIPDRLAEAGVVDGPAIAAAAVDAAPAIRAFPKASDLELVSFDH